VGSRLRGCEAGCAGAKGGHRELRLDLFLRSGGDGPALDRRGRPLVGPHETAARLLRRGPDVSVELSPALSEALGGRAHQLLQAAENVLRRMGPQAVALADALEQTAGVARGAESGDAPFVLVVSGSTASEAARPGVDGDGDGATPASRRAPALTLLEREIMARVAAGQTDGQIAAELFISRRTVQNHLHRIREKTGLLSRADLIRWVSTFARA
jgi:DNA-binding CsgD family transcriptional regulator